MGRILAYFLGGSKKYVPLRHEQTQYMQYPNLRARGTKQKNYSIPPCQCVRGNKAKTNSHLRVKALESAISVTVNEESLPGRRKDINQAEAAPK